MGYNPSIIIARHACLLYLCLTDKSLRYGRTNGIHNIMYYSLMSLLGAVKCELNVRNGL